MNEEYKVIMQLVGSLRGSTDKDSFRVINYGKTLEYLLNALCFYKHHLETEGEIRSGVIKAMKIVRDYCESNIDCTDCPIVYPCKRSMERFEACIPQEWEIKE